MHGRMCSRCVTAHGHDILREGVAVLRHATDVVDKIAIDDERT